MIREYVKIHDNFSIEIKLGFIGDKCKKKSKFERNLWIFSPENLDINESTYSKNNFYRDIRTKLRLITPIYSLSEISEGIHSPLNNISEALKNTKSENFKKELTYQLKMFSSIVKSSLRNTYEKIISSQNISETLSKDSEKFAIQSKKILEKFRSLYSPLEKNEWNNFFRLTDEFVSFLVEERGLKILKLTKENKVDGVYLYNFLKEEDSYRKSQNYKCVDKFSKNLNRDILLRQNLLKKYAESELFFRTDKKEDGFLLRQFLYSLAAGCSMIFATIIAFYYQLKYGNFTIPLFIALVIGYMFKDRIKELLRIYFINQVFHHFFDLKTKIKIGRRLVGEVREGFDFIKNNNIPKNITNFRKTNDAVGIYNKESVMLYRTSVWTNNHLLNNKSAYEVSGINTIFRFNIKPFLKKIDNPKEPLMFISSPDELVGETIAERVYYLNLILHIKDNDNTNKYRHYQIFFNRLGIVALNKI